MYSRWYFGKIKRIEAEKKLLMAQNEHGAFLIRDSESRWTTVAKCFFVAADATAK